MDDWISSVWDWKLENVAYDEGLIKTYEQDFLAYMRRHMLANLVLGA